ncbi:uncharacterized protein LOC135163096 [Diachasmimorpha longicaudata]|uniref:uncharacterized protein LOC135163096 n=1 Tax=Diachasmimorpha longicaudata TaxID=58733 RepID=UPI0030B90B71
MELIRLPLIVLLVLAVDKSIGDTRYYVKLQSDDLKTAQPQVESGEKDKSRAIYRLEDDDSLTRDGLKVNHDQRNSFVESSTFDPDVLNKFLDEYANKIRSTTEKSFYHSKTTRVPGLTLLEIDTTKNTEAPATTEEIVTGHVTSLDNLEGLNDTAKRNKFYSNGNDNRDGWVTLEAVPWSKSKISKWQANANVQRPWPEANKWDKPSAGKPWASDYSSRPHYENNKPWYDKPKPQWPDYEQPQNRPKPVASRPTYPHDQYEIVPSQAQKWPPERPNSAWEDFPSHHRPQSDIITDNRPANFPISNWEKYDQLAKPSYSFHDRFPTDPEESGNDWPNYPNKFDHISDKPNYMKPTRPFYSQYNYNNRHPPSHPSTGDGQWILLSTNRGYQKSRQRSLKFETVDDISLKPNGTRKTDESDPAIPVMTSKRQVRLTVLPSLNGTNTTTSHGGLLEVEKTFKTVDQSQREYEAGKVSQKVAKKRPLRTSVVGRPMNSAVLAAVGAGMLPATMAMMIPMMLGRKRRSAEFRAPENYRQITQWKQNFSISQ